LIGIINDIIFRDSYDFDLETLANEKHLKLLLSAIKNEF